MAINTSWKIKIGPADPVSQVDFTSRVQGMSINQQVDVNVIGRGTCTITLLNKDGALTPGGGGTYSSTDWFSQGVFITVLTNTGGANTETGVFYGIITNFDLVDDGVFSTVTLTAQDWLTVAGKTPNVANLTTGTVAYATGLTNALNVLNLDYPRLGTSTAPTISLQNLSAQNPNIYQTTASYSTAADLLQTGFIPSANDVVWAGAMQLIAGTELWLYPYCVPYDTTRTTANSKDFEFDPPASLSGSKLPFESDGFSQAFNNDTLINQNQILGQYAGATTVTSTNTTAQRKYGNRTVSYTNTFVLDATEATREADLLTNRYSTSRFTPVQLRTSASLVKRLAADAAHQRWHHLLSIADGIWQKAKITWTGSGAASQTAYSVIKGRKIDVTPSDTFVTLTLGNWTDNHSFILDTDVLDTDRLG